jgi:hypothetical protein
VNSPEAPSWPAPPPAPVNEDDPPPMTGGWSALEPDAGPAGWRIARWDAPGSPPIPGTSPLAARSPAQSAPPAWQPAAPAWEPGTRDTPAPDAAPPGAAPGFGQEPPLGQEPGAGHEPPLGQEPPPGREPSLGQEPPLGWSAAATPPPSAPWPTAEATRAWDAPSAQTTPPPGQAPPGDPRRGGFAPPGARSSGAGEVPRDPSGPVPARPPGQPPGQQWPGQAPAGPPSGGWGQPGPSAPAFGGPAFSEPWGGGRGWPLGPPAEEPEKSPKALTALLLSIASFIVCPLAAAIAGLVVAGQAAREIASSNGRLGGSGKVRAARVLGWLNIVAVIAGLVAGVALFPRLLGLGSGDPYAAVKASGAGTCIVNTDQPEIVPCADAHDGEQFAVIDLSGEAYPGDAQVDAEAERRCRAAFETFVGQPFEAQTALEAFTITPRKPTWDDGDRKVSCILTGAKGAKLTGSRQGAGAQSSP